jgi:O-antigen/teichoic acid export membrane protein
MSRTKNSLINLTAAMVGQLVAVPIGFVARLVFIRILGAEYLGINGLFNSILTMLSLVELGIGPAIVFSLYKPLAEIDTKKVQAIMQLYKKAYAIIGTGIVVLGIGMTPFLSYLIKDVPDVNNIEIIFLLFVGNSAISYFYAYKQNLIIADQRRYIVTIYRYAFFSFLNLMQIAFLYATKNYIFFLIVQIALPCAKSHVAKTADKLYPFLRQKTAERMDDETVREIKKNTGAMVSHKVGEIVTNSTDNIVISAMVGTIWVGLYSNYVLITIALNGIMGQFFSAITASIGNLGATSNKERLLVVFRRVQFATFWIFGFSAICLFYLFNPFIAVWIGKVYLLSMDTVLLLAVLVYVQGMRRAVLTFREALGLYWYDRYNPY